MNPSFANIPRYQVTMNGVPLVGVEHVRVTPANCFQVATFIFTKAFYGADAFPPSWWSGTANKTMLVSISMAEDGKTFTQVMLGNVDSHRYNPITNTITVTGRDLAAAMIDARITATYRNQTASEIAAAIAAEHGLQTSITPTKTIVGRYYSVDTDETQSGNYAMASNEWDLLCRLGSQAGIVPYVMGNTLYFNPPSLNPPIFAVKLTRDASGNIVSNVEDCDVERHMTIARDVIVTVQSWHSGKKQTFSATIRTRTRDESKDHSVLPSRYVFTVPNLTQAQCLVKAQQLAQDISQHERSITVSIASLSLMTPETIIQLFGTGTDYDQIYYPQTITYDMAFERGAATTVQAKFSSPLDLYDEDSGALVGEQTGPVTGPASGAPTYPTQSDQ